MKHPSKALSVTLTLVIVFVTLFSFGSLVGAAPAIGDVQALSSPVIFGDFNSYAIEGSDARVLTETGVGTGVFKGTFYFDAYTGAGDGYSLFTCISKRLVSVDNWQAHEFYTMAGAAAGMSSISWFKPTDSGKYEFTYTASTHVTTVIFVEYTLPKPVIYGVFNGWDLIGADAKPLTETGTGTGIFTAVYHFDAFTGAGDGYDLTTCITRKYYTDWSVWGAGEQYKMDGTVASMGVTSFFKPTVSGDYLVTYTASTHVTTLYLIVPFATPVIYGDFNGWALEGADACPLIETGAGTGVFKGIFTFNAYTGGGSGYYFTTSLSKKDSEWGFGSYEQYKMDGTVATFGNTSFFKPTVTGQYLVTYTAATHKTTAVLYTAPTTSDSAVVWPYFLGIVLAALAAAAALAGRKIVKSRK